MKYSQAIVVAAVASAAVVSAAPTAHQAGAHGKHTPQGKHASGTKPHLGAALKKAGASALRTAGGAEGAATHLGNLAMMYQSHKQNKAAAAAAASEEPVARAIAADAEAQAPVSAPATPAKASSTHPKEKATGTHDKKTNKSHHRHHPKKQEGKVHHTKESATPSKVTPTTESKVPTTPVATREFFDEEDLFERDLAELEELEARGRLSGIIGKARQAMKGHKMNTALTAASIGATVGTSVGIANSQKQQRDFTDEEFDELVARGKLGSLFSKARSAVKGHKVSGALTALNIGSQLMPQQQQQRDLADEDLELFERDLTDDEFDELVARGKLGALFSKARSAVKGHKVSGALTALNVGAQMMPQQQQQRDLSDEEFDELVARGKLGAIISKVRTGMKGHKMQTGLAAASIGASVGTSVGIANSQKQQQQQRDLSNEEFDELVARGKLGAIINKVRTGMKGHKMQTGLAAASIGASVGTSVGIANSQKQQRDLSDEEFDELVARGKLGSLFSKARSAIKGHKVSGALTALNVGAQMMPQQQQQRDLADEDLDLFERDFTDEEFDELVARGKLGSLFSKARSAVKGHKVSGALTALNVGASLMPQQQQRDLTDEEIYELVARGRLGSLISTARHALKGHKMDAAFTAANVASSIPHKQQPQQRDLEDFDELEMRDFDFEIDELD